MSKIKNQRKSVILGCVAMIASTILFSMMHVCVRYLGQEIHPFEIAFFRNFIACIFLLPLIVKDGGQLMKTA
ncbi:MAG: EamA family transporter, partial [Granulosicoccus sp.]